MTEPPLEAAREIARRAGMDQALAELSAISAHAARTGARVALVSAATRGRARIASRLIGRDVVAADLDGDLPVLITAGARDRLEAQTAQGLRVEVTDAGTGLLGPDTELLALPASGSDPGQTALAAADAVILCVQATVPMTLTETTLLTGLPDLGIPAARTLVLLMHLDLVAEEDRVALLDHVTVRARNISPGLTVLTDPGDPALGDAVRAWTAAAVLAHAGPARDRQIRARLAACLREMEASARASADQAKLSQDEAALAADSAAVAIAAEMTGFDQIRVKAGERMNAAIAEFQAGRDRFRHDLLAGLLHQLGTASDPASWWEKDLSYQLQVDMPRWEESVRTSLRDRLAADTRAVELDLYSAYGMLAPQQGPLTVPGTEAPPVGAPPVQSLRNRQLVYRTGPAAVAIAAVLAIPAIGPIAALTAGLAGTGLAEIRLRGMADQHRNVIRERLPALIDEAVDEYSRGVLAALEPAYQQLEDAIGAARDQWEEERQQAGPPSADTGTRDLAFWSAIADDSARLIAEIGA